MYNEKLEKLIEAALVDGELLEKEKQVLFKKAEELGVDLDEFEMVLQARLFEKQKDKKNVSAAPKSDKLGDIKKCPACGAIAETFATKCSNCGTEFRNVEASKNIIKFFEKLDDIESKRSESESKWEKFLRADSGKVRWSTIDSRKEELVLNFPVPTSKEEILEFLTLATSRIKPITSTSSDEEEYINKWNQIWLNKIEQIHSKALLSMKNDKSTLDEINKLVENARMIVKVNNKKTLSNKYRLILTSIFIVVGGFILLYILPDKQEGRENLKKDLKAKAETFIKNGEYDKAEEIIKNIEDESVVVELKSKIQLEELSKKLDALEIYLEKKDYSKLKFELEKIIWTKISKTDYYDEKIERNFFEAFLKKKKAINAQLPEKYKIEIEESL